MTHIPATRIAAQAESHLGQSGPLNTCMSNGLERWTTELGLKGLDTASVTEGVARAQRGYNGWKYVEGTKGIERGNFGVWANIYHVTCVTDVRGQTWHGIGSGTPSNEVAIQPQAGGYNPLTILKGYLVAPTETGTPAKPATPAPVKAKPATSSGTEYTIVRGDTLIRIAARHHTTWQKIFAANPPSPDGKWRNHHIVSPGKIYAGQKILIP